MQKKIHTRTRARMHAQRPTAHAYYEISRFGQKQTISSMNSQFDEDELDEFLSRIDEVCATILVVK